jgi:hypothetical protein
MTRERLEQIYNKERGIPQAHEIADLVCEIERCWSELARYKALVDRLAALETEWRLRHSDNGGDYYYDGTWEACADELARALKQPAPPAKPEHVCGLTGYNGMIDPPCPGCVERNMRALKETDHGK